MNQQNLLIILSSLPYLPVTDELIHIKEAHIIAGHTVPIPIKPEGLCGQTIFISLVSGTYTRHTVNAKNDFSFQMHMLTFKIIFNIKKKHAPTKTAHLQHSCSQ